MVGPLLEVEMSKKCTPLWREAHFEVKMYKTHYVRTKSKCTKNQGFGPLLEAQMSFRVAGARDCGSCQKCAKHEGFAAFRQKMAGMGHLQMISDDLQRRIFRGRRRTKDMFMREVGRSGR